MEATRCDSWISVILALGLLFVPLGGAAAFPQAPVPEPLPRVPDPKADDDKSYLIPAAEILSFEFLLNQYDRRVVDSDVYGSTFSTFKDNLHRGWIVDHDPFATNQLFHPYAGSLYFGFARSSGLGFWQSCAYTFLGSALWELAGETGRPSLNDQLTTGISGNFLGESMFRIAGWILADEDGEPGFFHEVAAAIASPPSFVNRHAFGGRFAGLFPADEPAVLARLRLSGRTNVHVDDGGLDRNVRRNELVGGFTIDSGLPGKPGYHYDEPFDFFHFDIDATSTGDSAVENANARGLILGGKYGEGDHRGIVGLFGSYSYLSPEVFRVSTTALAFGTIEQWWLSDEVALQGTFLGGPGYGASGTIADEEIDRDYHYGAIPQAQIALRLVFGDLATFDLEARDFYVSGVASDRKNGHENIAVGQAALTFHLYERHSIGIQYDYARRDAPFSSLPSRRQTVEAVSLVYSFTFGNAHARLGAVEWRDGHGR